MESRKVCYFCSYFPMHLGRPSWQLEQVPTKLLHEEQETGPQDGARARYCFEDMAPVTSILQLYPPFCSLLPPGNAIAL